MATRNTKRPSLCQNCGNSFVKIVRHKCKKKTKRSTIQPILPAPAPAVDSNKNVQRSSSADRLADVPLPAFYPLPHSFDDRAISPLSLCPAAQMHQLSPHDLWAAENEHAVQLPEGPQTTEDPQRTASKMLSQVRSVEMDNMNSAINQSKPFDPTNVSPKIASGYPYKLSSTLSPPLNTVSYNQDTGTTPIGAIHSNAIPDHDILMPTIESPDADHPFVEEHDMAGSGVRAIGFEDLINWENFEEHGDPVFL